MTQTYVDDTGAPLTHGAGGCPTYVWRLSDDDRWLIVAGQNTPVAEHG